ncbi:major facilitator superfamily domain-containing protein [Endogone sp. FLAS-F59071]|nr:major facilitator superfamily domain-containing protein [Endogone sp. FLAS-F59071]|eukprot:RUS19133.1 major facilitator superfamily domain-containing protein [Endogone sp. FLAS-F59071]
MTEKFKRIDFLGTIIIICGTICLLLPVQWGGNQYAWNSAVVISLFVVSVVIIGVFSYVELYQAREPIIPGRLFKLRTPMAVFVMNFFFGIAFFSVIYYSPLYFQVVRGDSATISGLELLPLMLGVVFFSIGSGIFTARTGIYRPVITLGCALATIGCSLLSTWTAYSNRGQQIGYLLVTGVGLGMCVQTMLLAAQTSVTYKDIAVITALCNFFRTIGGVLGISISGAIFNNKLSQELLSLNANISIQMAENSVTFVRSLPQPIMTNVIDGYVSSLDLVYLVAAPLAGCSFIASLFVQHFKLRKSLGASAME